MSGELYECRLAIDMDSSSWSAEERVTSETITEGMGKAIADALMRIDRFNSHGFTILARAITHMQNRIEESEEGKPVVAMPLMAAARKCLEDAEADRKLFLKDT